MARMPRIVRQEKKYTWIALGVFVSFVALFLGTLPTATVDYVGYNQDGILKGTGFGVSLKNRLGDNDGYGLRAACVVLGLWVGLNAAFLTIPTSRKWMTVIYKVLLLILELNLILWEFKSYDMLPQRIDWIQAESFLKFLQLWIPSVAFVGAMLWTVYENRDGHSAGLWPLIAPGFVAVVGIGAALAMFGNQQGSQPALWPFFIGGLAFLFFWKLAAILFDLTFVWHLYIRHNRMLAWMRDNLPQRPNACVESSAPSN